MIINAIFIKINLMLYSTEMMYQITNFVYQIQHKRYYNMFMLDRLLPKVIAIKLCATLCVAECV